MECDGTDEATPNPDKSEDFVLVKAIHLLLPMLLDLYSELNGTAPLLRCIEAIQRYAFFYCTFLPLYFP